jgi:putative transposase
MMLVSHYRRQASVSSLCAWLNLPTSTWYYQPHDTGNRGIKPSTETLCCDGSRVSNEQVVEHIRQSLSREFCCYGYHTMTSELKDAGYIINHKKVYRLMAQENLLLGKVIRTSGKREFVRFRKITAAYPMEYVCLDIKYVWVGGENRNYYLLTLLDVFSRKAIDQIFQRSIKQVDVLNAFRRINILYGLKGITVRNDNGSQFIANSVRLFLQSEQVRQEFTHIATPQENSYIEAFHSIIDREVIQRFEFSNYEDARLTFDAHREWYNYVRKHGSLKKITPQQKWELYEKQKLHRLTILAASDKAETGPAGEQPVRNSPMIGDRKAEVMKVTSALLSNLSLCKMPEKTQHNGGNDLNSGLISLQLIGG